MADYKLPKPVKLIVPLLGSDLDSINIAYNSLQKEFGATEISMENIPFEWTNYYQQDVGDTPIRTIISFKDLIPREDIIEIKRKTNEIELELFGGKRKVNIDPGYMTMGQFFLATTKDQQQRVYVGNGIFIDPTLYFRNKEFQWYEWTYYDYRSPIYHRYLKSIRAIYHQQLRELNLGDNN